MKFLKNSLLLTLAVMCCSAATLAANRTVTPDEVAAILKSAGPGDVIVVKNGTYNDADLRWKGTGGKDNPVRIVAETPSGVIFSGNSTLKFAGEWLHIEGLWFKDGHATGNSGVITYRLGDDLANNCRVTECAVTWYNPESRIQQYSYVLMYGRNNRFDHNTLLGKLNIGVTLNVMLNDPLSRANYHSIDNNYFGTRPVYGSNGAETIRVGSSHQAGEAAHTLIKDNVFEHCNGEVEVVSIKSCDNRVEGNVFYECEGVLALRHGDRNVASKNIFVGNNKRNTGGVRVVGVDQQIVDNTFYYLRGGRFFAPLALMNAVPNSLPSRYVQVQDVMVRGNMFVDCSAIEFGTGRDAERTLPPDRITFSKNTIVSPNAAEPFMAVDDVSGFTFSDNLVSLSGDIKLDGFKTAKIKVAAVKSREELLAGKGPQWYNAKTKASVAPMAAQGYIHGVKPGDDLTAIVDGASAGDVIELTESGGDYRIQSSVVVKVPLTIRAANGLKNKPVLRFYGQKGGDVITIADGGSLIISGIAFNGKIPDGASGAKAGISSAKIMIKPYSLEVSDCEFYDFGESDCFAIKGSKNTFAEKITVRNCLFRGLAGDAINFADEKDDKGRYNAEDVLIEDCAFYRLMGLGINIYRGGSDESTAGPYITVRNCNFEDVCNKERGSVMRLIGPQVMDITSCNFSNSGRGGAAVRLDETPWEKITISDCNLFNSGPVVSMKGNAVKGGMVSIEPTYIDAKTFDFRIKDGNGLKALNIGLK